MRVRSKKWSAAPQKKAGPIWSRSFLSSQSSAALDTLPLRFKPWHHAACPHAAFRPGRLGARCRPRRRTPVGRPYCGFRAATLRAPMMTPTSPSAAVAREIWAHVARAATSRTSPRRGGMRTRGRGRRPRVARGRADPLRAGRTHREESPHDSPRGRPRRARGRSRARGRLRATGRGAVFEATLARMSIGARKPTMRRFVDGAGGGRSRERERGRGSARSPPRGRGCRARGCADAGRARARGRQCAGPCLIAAASRARGRPMPDRAVTRRTRSSSRSRPHGRRCAPLVRK